MGRNVISALYYAMVVVCVAISVYLSYYGYVTSFEALALPFAIVLGIGLFGADALIQKNRVQGKSLIWPVLLFVFVAFFSAASNFNYLYTNFMRKDVLESTLDSQYATFRNNMTEARDRLISTEAFTYGQARRTDLARELERLQQQVLDPLRPGCGERCREHLREIERILGAPMSETATPQVGAPRAQVEDWLSRVDQAARADLVKALGQTGHGPVVALVKRIDALLLEHQTPDQALASGQGLQILGVLSEQSAEIERTTNPLLPTGAPLRLQRIDPTLGRLGEIVYSFENAFQEMPNPLATAVSAILAVVVDVLPVFFALVAFSPEAPQNAPRRSKRMGTVLD